MLSKIFCDKIYNGKKNVISWKICVQKPSLIILIVQERLWCQTYILVWQCIIGIGHSLLNLDVGWH